MKAREIMTSKLECVTPQDSVSEAARIMRDRDVGIVPVVDDRSTNRLAGVITDRDITVRCIAEGRDGSCTVSEVMSSDIITARPDDDVNRIMERMGADQVRRVPVVDDDNRIVGIIAQADIALEGPSDRKVGEVVERISEPGGRK